MLFPVAYGTSRRSAWTRYLNAPSGGLALTVDNTGAVVVNLANLHGDIVATAAPTDTGPATYLETTEYGLPRDPGAPGRRYGWLGTHHRNTGDTLAQLTLMGVRLYNPTTGRFLSVDPIAGGSCNDYDYTCADPINGLDLDGKRWCVFRKCFGSRKQPKDGSCGTCYVRRAAEGYHRTRVRVCAWTTGFSGHVFGGFLSIRYVRMTFRRSSGYWWGFTAYCYWRY